MILAEGYCVRRRSVSVLATLRFADSVPRANVDYKYLFHMTRPSFLLIDECTYLDGADSAFQAANESM
jgi:hypothetical protein